ncbi:hypothetical protein EUA06_11935 [Nocardioides glacieisoli]|uniref:Uncharacterized protein n=1 Tax=Nocardioides glacieisoli TaxID=1168730 RepID=A0A4Q2RNT8_9ACTN|nr:hypothetical protein [Nocardioides glacieisoli]RYB90106.1 hypothetical protein EUA06_11935 [Nocardioides glacieisoli]
MADTGKPDDDSPSLEMPSFSLRRKKKEAPPEDVAPEPQPEPEPAPIPEPEPEPEPEPVAKSESAPVPEPEPVPAAEPVPAPVPEPETVPAPEPEPEPAAYDAPTAVVPVVHEAAEPSPPEPEDEPARERRELPLSGLAAAAATGVAVGVLAVLFSWLATSACEAVRGTSSCGGGPGFVILLVVLALLAVAGAWLLDIFGEPDYGSTSLLAVGIMAVLVMVFLLGSLDEPWAVIAVPVTAVIGYCVSWWVTHAVVGDEAPQETAEPRDVR